MEGKDIKEGRLKMNLTQEKLAEMIGVEKRTIINYEQGKVIPKAKIELLKRVFSSKETESLEDIIYDRIENKFKNRLSKIEKAQKILQEDFVKLFKMVLNKDVKDEKASTRKQS